MLLIVSVATGRSHEKEQPQEEFSNGVFPFWRGATLAILRVWYKVLGNRIFIAHTIIGQTINVVGTCAALVTYLRRRRPIVRPVAPADTIQ